MKNSDLNAIVERVLQRIVEVEESDPDDIEETTTDTSMTYGGNQANEVSKKTAKKQVKALGGPKFSDKGRKGERMGRKGPGSIRREQNG